MTGRSREVGVGGRTVLSGGRGRCPGEPAEYEAAGSEVHQCLGLRGDVA